MLAAKFFDDQYFNNAYYAKVGGVPCHEINSLEVEFLFMINFSLFVTTGEYEQVVPRVCAVQCLPFASLTARVAVLHRTVQPHRQQRLYLPDGRRRASARADPQGDFGADTDARRSGRRRRRGPRQTQAVEAHVDEKKFSKNRVPIAHVRIYTVSIKCCIATTSLLVLGVLRFEALVAGQAEIVDNGVVGAFGYEVRRQVVVLVRQAVVQRRLPLFL